MLKHWEWAIFLGYMVWISHFLNEDLMLHKRSKKGWEALLFLEGMNCKKRKKQGITSKEGRSVCNVRSGSDVGHNSSFFPMTHSLASQRDCTRSQDFHYYLRAPWVILLAGGVLKHPDCPSPRTVRWNAVSFSLSSLYSNMMSFKKIAKYLETAFLARELSLHCVIVIK